MQQITLFPETKFKKNVLGRGTNGDKSSGEGDTPPHTHPHLRRLDPRFPRAYGARHPPPPFEILDPPLLAVTHFVNRAYAMRDRLRAP